jgi:DNA-binding MarR family transcriptional regulator
VESTATHRNADGTDADAARTAAASTHAASTAATSTAAASTHAASTAAAGASAEPDAGQTPHGRANLSAGLGIDTASRVMGRLFGMAPQLVELLDLGAREYGMSYARGRVVAALHTSGPVLMRALSQAVGVSPRTITGLVDALEADGWVQRRAHPTDRRATIVALTPAAEAAFGRLLQGYQGMSEDLLRGVPEADQRRALSVIDHISARLDEAIARGTAAFDANPPSPVKPQDPAPPADQIPPTAT